MAREVGSSHRTLRGFLADVSHELRTPLTSIRGFSQAMTDGALRTPRDYAEAGQVIHDEADRMARLVEDLLYLSRVESGQLAVEQHPVDLAALVGACVGRAERRASAGGLTVTYDAAGVPPVLGEAHRLEQVVDNLLDNALKHTPRGGAITVRLAEGAPGTAPAARGTAPPAPQSWGGRDGGVPGLASGGANGKGSGAASGRGVWLSVHNTGSAIPAEDQPRVFERFYRAQGGAHSEGLGLGLAIARQVVESHRGRIGVMSSPEGGTEFAVWLPALAAGAPTLKSVATRPGDTAGTPPAVGSVA
jgi:signal transduction histidine kinase